MAEPRFGHVFANPELLQRALTHRSVGAANNERLEFLGDAILNALAADALFQRWPRADEGALTRGRAALVRESSLAAIARQLSLGEYLALGPGELKSGGHRRDSILADALEAVIGAVYLDAGFEAARRCVLTWIEPVLASIQPGQVGKDAKTQLQEWLQARQLGLPEYGLIEARGEEHSRVFRVSCQVEALQLGSEGEGNSRRLAEQAAATQLLRVIEAQA